MSRKKGQRPRGWEPVADWYQGWAGKSGSEHHQKLAIPAVLELLDVQPDEAILDVGCGPGALAPHISRAGATYTGVDVSESLVGHARREHKQHGQFHVGDARHLANVVSRASFDAVVFLLSIQDMDPLPQVLASARGALRDGGRMVILMTHPCFRIPRQSGWGEDEGRKLRFRRVDSYLSALSVPMKAATGGRGGTTISFHRPLSTYINTLADNGLAVDAMREITTHKEGRNKQEKRANQEIPLFLALRARHPG